MSSIADLIKSSGEFGKDAAFLGIGGFVQGIVTDNGVKDFAGMVKVEFVAWKSGKNICQWIPILRSYAGADYGSYLVPEVGDHVLVGFIGAGQERPFVVGSFYPSQAKYLSESFMDKNTHKRFKTKGKIDIVLSDEDGKQSITATTPKGMTMVLEDEKETATLSDKKGENALTLDSKNGTITIEAKSKLVIKAGKCEITLDGQGGAINIKCDQFAVKATRQAEISANQQLTVTGGMLTAEGKQTAQLKGGAMTEVKGGMVKIN